MAYMEGTGVPKDEAEAIVWLRRAADQDSGWAQFYLGNAYHGGRGVPKDGAQAVEWWRRAAEKGYAFAESNLGAAYATGEGVERDYGRAAFWFASALRHGHTAGPRRLRTEIRAAADPAAEVLRMGNARERAHVLSRTGDWVEIYLAEGHTVGHVRADALR
jgi:TPR repeat protein